MSDSADLVTRINSFLCEKYVAPCDFQRACQLLEEAVEHLSRINLVSEQVVSNPETKNNDIVSTSSELRIHDPLPEETMAELHRKYW